MGGVTLAGLGLDELLTRRRGLRRQLLERDGLRPLRIAVLGGSTAEEVLDLTELLLLDAGFRPEFWQSGFGRFYEDAVHDADALVAFEPEIVFVHTSVKNLRTVVPMGALEEVFDAAVAAEFGRYREIWDALDARLGCLVIQNNFELPAVALLGNLDAVATGGRTRFVNELNRQFAQAARGRSKLIVQDVCSLAARVGLDRWFDAQRWLQCRMVTTPAGSYALAQSLAALVRGVYGGARKVLVLDLDQTLWGGVIGDDGVDGIAIGRETAVAEAYTAFQEYCLYLRARGVLLAVCSKNDEAVAKAGFSHPDSLLKLSDFAAFKANWEPKHENVQAIARELNLGTESFVFVDDNPAERAIVEAQVRGIAVPDIGTDPAGYAAAIEAGRYFEQVAFSDEDLRRAALYAGNAVQAEFAGKFADYGEYLDSLAMTAEIGDFKAVYLDRITQLANKTNQFNLTTRRYTRAEIDAVASDPEAVCLYGRLRDRFGDHGLVSVVVGRRVGDAIEIELWLMSCRVLKRDMELAMLDALAARASAMGVVALLGVYVPSARNGMVADHYDRLGFSLQAEEAGRKVYRLELRGYIARNQRIRVEDGA